MPKKRPKVDDDKGVDMQELAKVMDFVKSGDFRQLIEDFMSGDARGYKDLASLQNKFASRVFDWDNDETKKPARDAFLKLTSGYNRLSETFSPEQKVIAEDADFKESVTGLVLSMRDQMEHFKEDAKVQSRRFYISTAIAVASIAVTGLLL